MAPTIRADSHFKVTEWKLFEDKSLLSQYSISEKCEFLGAYTKLQKVTIRFVTPACLFVRMEQLGSHRKDFHEISIFECFSKICPENSSLF
jgi:hypothetical protein